MNFLTEVGNWEVSTTSWRKSTRRVPLTDSQAVADRVRRELIKRTLKPWMTLYWVRRTSAKRTDRRAKFHVKRIHCSSVHRIIHCDRQLKCLKRRRVQQRVARLTRCKQLLKRYDDSAVDFIWFTNEKVFTVEPPFTLQNDRVYVPVGTKKRFIQLSRLLRTCSTFSKSVMVSVAVSKWEWLSWCLSTRS